MPDPQHYQTPTTLQQVRDFVLADPATNPAPAHLLLLNVDHANLKSTHLVELRIDPDSTVDALKQKLYLHTGTRPASMRLFVRDPHTASSRPLSDPARTLRQCAVRSGDSLLVIDDDPFSPSANGWLEDVSLVPRYRVSEEQYDKAENTYRRFKKRMREKDPNWSMTSALARQVNAAHTARAADLADERPPLQPGNRVEVFPGAKRAEVCFVGRDLQHLPDGWWVGVRYDEPVGKNDGTVKGVRYFNAPMKFGGLVRPSNCTVGDYPPLQLDDSDDEL